MYKRSNRTQNDYIYCCPVCGSEYCYPESEFELYSKIECVKCRAKDVIPFKSHNTYDYYRNESYKQYNNYSHWKEIFVEKELSKNPQFDKTKAYNIENLSKEDFQYRYYCPICGNYSSFGKGINNCTRCGKTIPIQKTKYPYEYYYIQSMAVYGDFKHWKDILIEEEIKPNPFFDEKIYEYLKGTPSVLLKRSQGQSNTPKCPTCGSTKIKKISYTSKLVGAAIFGLLSKTARSQFCCESCGYKW